MGVDARPFNHGRDDMVPDETLEILKTPHGKEIDISRIEKIVFSIFFTGVKLSDGSGGVAYTPTAHMHSATCCPTMATERPAPVLLEGMTVSVLATDLENFAVVILSEEFLLRWLVLRNGPADPRHIHIMLQMNVLTSNIAAPSTAT